MPIQYITGSFNASLAQLNDLINQINSLVGTGSGAVDSVNGMTGVVTLTASDVGALALADAGSAALLDIDTDGTLAADSDTLIATQKAVKTYVDATAVGAGSLADLSDCVIDYDQANMALGQDAGSLINLGANNTALGTASMGSLTDGLRNTAVGTATLSLYTGSSTYSDNTAIGYSALNNITLDRRNTAVGSSAGNLSGNENTAVGYQALTTSEQSNNTAIGSHADVADSTITNATAVGYQATAQSGNTVQLGNTNVNSVVCGNSGAATLFANLQTQNTPNATAGVVKIGGVVTGASTPDATQYIEITIDGTIYKLVIAT